MKASNTSNDIESPRWKKVASAKRKHVLCAGYQDRSGNGLAPRDSCPFKLELPY